MNMINKLNFISDVADSDLGKQSSCDHTYNPDRLFPIPRAGKRIEIGIDLTAPLPFTGFDCWNHYEVSWLNQKGKPMVATAEIIYDCSSPFIVESKSLKLYFNSFNQTSFKSIDLIKNIIQQDLEKILQSPVTVNISPLGESRQTTTHAKLEGESIDDLDIDCTTYTIEPSYLTTLDEQVEETLCSDLLKSNCLVTNQPDWGSVQISYKGKKINREGLLRYLVSYRNHNEFHEQCIERIFMDIMTHCKPDELTVYGRYTRRGGIDINPYRTTKQTSLNTTYLNQRLVRQ